MKKLKRVLTLGIVLALVLGLLAACGQAPAATQAAATTAAQSSENAAAATGITRNEKGYPDFGGRTFTIWQRNFRTDVAESYSEFANIKELEKLFNMKIEFVHPPMGQEAENFSMMIASKTLPDMIFSSGIDEYYAGGLGVAYDDGILYDYTQYVNEKDTPNFLKVIESADYLKKIASDDQGRIVRLGAKIQGSETADFQFNGLLLRKDMLEKTGKAVPSTIAEWTDVLGAMKANGVEYPLGVSSGNNLQPFAMAYGIDSKSFNIQDGKLVFGPYTPEFKEYLTVMNDWFSKGYINPDYMNTDDPSAVAMLSGDRVGATNMHLWFYKAVYFPTTEKENPAKGLVPAQMPVLNSGDPLPNFRYTSRNVDDYKYITADAKDPLACVYLLDALYLPEIDRMMGLGMEGTGWEEKDGKTVTLPLPENADKETLLKTYMTQWHTTEDTDAEVILTQKYSDAAIPDALKLWSKCGTDGFFNEKYIYLNPEEAKVKSTYGADITTYVAEMTMKFITGSESLDNYDAYLANLKKIGVEDYIAAYQTAYDRYSQR